MSIKLINETKDSPLNEVRNDPEYRFDFAIFSIVDEIWGIMNDKKISKSELAERMGVKPAYITKILSGDYNFPVKSLLKVAAALEVDLNISLGKGKPIIAENKKNSIAM